MIHSSRLGLYAGVSLSLMLLLAGACQPSGRSGTSQPGGSAAASRAGASPTPAALTPTPAGSVPATPTPSAPATKAPASPTPTSTEGPPAETRPTGAWKTFFSADLQIVLDYPADWSVTEQATGATLVSPQGTTLQLTLIETGDLSPGVLPGGNPLPNTRCSSSVNAYGVTVKTCLDTVSRSVTAYFVLEPTHGPARLFALSTPRASNLEVLQAVSDSVRPWTPED